MAKDGERWFDHGTGMKGDIVDLAAVAWDCTVPEAMEKLSLLTSQAEAPKPQGQYEAAKEVEWPADLRRPTILECESLGMLRQIIPNAFDLAANLGCLKVGTYGGELLWFLTDASGKGAEGKTFTGDPCLASGDKVAALPGTNKKGWCYGLKSERSEWDAIDKLILVEGVPDFFAALALLIDWPGNARIVTMLGARNKPGEETREYFRGKEVLIIPHNDEDGKQATKIWVDCITGFGARVFVQKLPSGKDLNEFMIAPGDENPLDLLKGLAQWTALRNTTQSQKQTPHG